MFFAFIIQSVFCCRPFFQERNFFPTYGEYYTIGLDQLFTQECQEFQCQGCSDGITVNNATNVMYSQYLDYNFSQVIQNYTHFAGLADNLLVIYEKVPNSFEIQQVSLFETPQDYNCINLVFTQYDSIVLLDCYLQNGTLSFFQLKDQQFGQVYNTNSSYPNMSQFQHYYNQGQEYILYAQYFQISNQSILSLLVYTVQFYANISKYNCSQGFQNFQSTKNYIYIQYDSQLYQVSFNNITRKLQCNFQYYQFVSPIISFSSYYSMKRESQADQLIVILQQYWVKIIGGLTYHIQGQINLNFQPNTYIKWNDDFIFLQNKLILVIIKNDISNQVLQTIELPENSLLMFDDLQNMLYIFGSKYQLIKFEIPQLKINTTILQQNNINISIVAGSIYNNCSSNFSITVLNDSDTNLYLQFISQKNVFYESKQYDEQINQYSGQLLNFNQFRVNSDLGYFKDTTVQQLDIKIGSNYNYCQILQIPSQQYFINVCAFNNSLNYYQCFSKDNYQLCDERPNFPIKFSGELILQIEVAYNLNNDTIIGVLVTTSQIACIFVPGNWNLNSTQSTINVEDSISSYFVNYAGLFILLSNQSINFYSNQGHVLTIDQNLINILFNKNANYSFNPIGMTQNIQFLSSILFINNQSNVLIISIIQNQAIPITRIQNILNNTNSIYEINIVNERLIITYYQNYLVTFYVWNLYNIYKPYYEKQLMAINTNNLIKIFSDNLFFYVQFNESQLYIYNPALSQHSALLTNLSFSGNAFLVSTAYFIYPDTNSAYSQRLQSILSCNNSFYLINSIIKISFILNKSNFIEYPSIYYSYTVSTLLSSTSYFTNYKQLIYLYNFTKMNSINSKTIQNGINFISTIVPNNSQLAYCIPKTKYNYDYAYQVEQHQNNSFQNYKTRFLKSSLLISQLQNFLIYQDSSVLYFSSLPYIEISNPADINYSYLSLNKCLNSTSNNFLLVSICSNSTSAYILQFDFSEINNANLANVTQLKKIETQLGYNFFQVRNIQILSQGILFIGLEEQSYMPSLYLFNQMTNETKNLIPSTFCVNYISAEIKFLTINRIVIIFIRNSEMSYLVYNNYFKQIQSIKQIFIPNLNVIQYKEIILISQQNRYIIFLLTTTGNQFIFFRIHFSIQTEQDGKVQFIYQINILRLLPALYQAYIIQNTLYQNGYLVIFYQSSEYILFMAFYDVNSVLNTQQLDLRPVLMQQLIHLQYPFTTFFVFYNSSSQLFNVFLINEVDELFLVAYQVDPELSFSFDNLQLDIICCSNLLESSCQNFIIKEYKKVVWNIILILIVIIFLIFCLVQMIYNFQKKHPEMQAEYQIKI